jgi:hypothetical protein
MNSSFVISATLPAIVLIVDKSPDERLRHRPVANAHCKSFSNQSGSLARIWHIDCPMG